MAAILILAPNCKGNDNGKSNGNFNGNTNKSDATDLTDAGASTAACRGGLGRGGPITFFHRRDGWCEARLALAALQGLTISVQAVRESPPIAFALIESSAVSIIQKLVA